MHFAKPLIVSPEKPSLPMVQHGNNAGCYPGIKDEDQPIFDWRGKCTCTRVRSRWRASTHKFLGCPPRAVYRVYHESIDAWFSTQRTNLFVALKHDRSRARERAPRRGSPGASNLDSPADNDAGALASAANSLLVHIAAILPLEPP